MTLTQAPSLLSSLAQSTRPSNRRQTVRDPQLIESWIQSHLPFMDNPEIYASGGDEMNTVHRDWDSASLRICLVGGMAYRNSVGNLAIPLVYSELTEQGDPTWYVDRAHLWETRKNFIMFSRDGIPPIGLQSHRSLADYDVLAFSCSYLQTILHVGLMLKHAGIPWHSDERAESDPLVLGGGHHFYVNPEPIWRIIDLAWVGEFSAGGVNMFRAYAEAKAAGVPRWDWIRGYLRDSKGEPRRGFYVPALYAETYSKHHPYPIANKVPLIPEAALPVPKAYVANLDTGAHINERPIVSFLNPGMGTAEVQSSFGCDTATCTFCSEGQTNKPFRFYSVSRLVKAMKEQMRTSGMKSVTLSAFDGAGHPQKRSLIRRLLQEVSDSVGLLSLRVDEMAEDDIFSVVSTAAGNKTLSMGVEGMSERMRVVYQKWCSEAQILRVCEKAMAAGATKIKFFMICNHPWETEEDRMEWIRTLKKVEAIKTRLGSKCQILTSWTPLVIMPWTPLQWEAPTPDDRTLNGIIQAIKAETKTDFRIGSGGRRDEAYMAQLLQLADRRADVLVDWCIDNDFIHYGSTPKYFKEKIDTILAGIPGYERPLGFHTWFRTKPYSEILPWSHIGVGVSREWLIMVNEISKLGQQQIPTCVQQCSACGACTDEDRVKMAAGHLLKDDDFELHEIDVIRQRGTVQMLRLKLNIDRDHRFIGDEYWIAGIRRAFFMAGLPVDKTRVSVVGQRYKFYDYTYGVEYADVGMMERIRAKDALQIAQYLPRGMTLVDTRTYSPTVGLFRRTVGYLHFTAKMKGVFTVQETKAAIEQMLGAQEFIATIKQKAFRKGVISVKVDVRKWIHTAFLEPDGTLHLLTGGSVNPYELLPAMFKCSRRKILPLDITRQECYLSEGDEVQEDFLRPFCPVTGEKVKANLFDETDPSGLAVQAQYVTVPLNIVKQERIVVDTLEADDLATDVELATSQDLFEEQMREELAYENFGKEEDREGM